jgi:hypothetical protein
MPITFDPANKRIILDSNSVTASQIWIAWVDWVATSDNAKWLPALKQTGGDPLQGSISIPPYIFLINNWRVRPQESNHDLILDGNLFVEGGGTPVVRTIGNYQVNVAYVVPVQAQVINTGSSGSASDVMNYPISSLTDKDTFGGYIIRKLLSRTAAIALK